MTTHDVHSFQHLASSSSDRRPTGNINVQLSIDEPSPPVFGVYIILVSSFPQLVPTCTRHGRISQVVLARICATRYIKLRTRVDRDAWDAELGLWKIACRTQGQDTQERTEFFNLTLISNGYYYLSNTHLSAASKPGSRKKDLAHSAWYRQPPPTDRGKIVLVVGGGTSGSNIAAEVAAKGRATVVHSFPQPEGTQKPPVSALLDV
ncbi:monooxygenase [Marasmius crinis-equi]|uniref:Monooxygenase n=1 Tax=Marasmius crinis-equi TaxID=585013 RepID=A0ABR3EZU6_9AGAR